MICSSRPMHVHTAPHPSRTAISHHLSYTAQQHRAQRQAAARALHASATAYASSAHPLLCPAQNPASVPLLTFARKHVWMALHVLAQCTARLLLAHQQKQKQGCQRAGIGSRDSEEEGMRSDRSVYCALANLKMEERVKGGLVRLRLHPAHPQASNLLMRSCHSYSQGCMV